MVTIKNVAKHARVSIGTVSNVLSGKRPVSDEVRQRVLHAIDELGYQPDMVAQSLVTGRSGIIGMVIPSYKIVGLLTAIDAETAKFGYSLLVSKLGQNENPINKLQSLISRRVDGVIWLIPETDTSHQWISDIQMAPRFPVVLALCSPKRDYSTVWIDNFSGGYQAAQHLIQHGCRNIAHITGPKDHRESKERLAGWAAALSEAGIEPFRVMEGGWYVRYGWHAMQNILEKWPDIDGVFVAADEPALGAISVLQQSGRKIPDDVKVIGFDDLMDLDYYNPPLTTIHQDFETLGASLVKELSRRIQDPSVQPEALVLPTHLVTRQSCGCDRDVE